ncbi:MAG TPA: lysophospholipid acyltransferase family protein [Candidatus Binataceae bacterium]|nr:lysophospholipid acyltransferase family protein [Candidatus Binataceae bacterium]
MANAVDTSPDAAGAPRTALNLAWGIAATIVSVLWTALLAPIAAFEAAMGWHRAVTEISRVWARAIIALCGVRVEIDGMENLSGVGSFILVANHKSFFDIFALAAYCPGEPRFVAKRELLKIPFVGYAMQNSGHVIIHRQSGGKEIRKAVQIIRRGYNLTVFAEGHRFNDNQVHEFSDGAAWLAILAKLPAVPVAISGSGAFMPRGAKVVNPGGTMRIAFGKPIPTAEMKSSDRTELTHRLEEQVRMMYLTEV